MGHAVYWYHSSRFSEESILTMTLNMMKLDTMKASITSNPGLRELLTGWNVFLMIAFLSLGYLCLNASTSKAPCWSDDL
jgi:hypothetical protein